VIADNVMSTGHLYSRVNTANNKFIGNVATEFDAGNAANNDIERVVVSGAAGASKIQVNSVSGRTITDAAYSATLTVV
jgi:hypothetical protein